MNRFRLVLLAVAVAATTTACGRKAALIYPDMLIPAAPSDVSVQQSGPAVKLIFTLPDKDRAGRTLPGVAGVKISRRSAEGGQKDVCPACTADYRLLETIYLEHLPPVVQRFGNRLVVLDSDVIAGNTYSYRATPFTADGVEGALSAPAEVQTVSALPAPELTIDAFPTEVRFSLKANLPATAKLLGFNLYRSSGTGSRSYLPLNREPLTGGTYADATLERGVKYRYSARMLILPASGGVVESLESNVVEGMLKDDE